MYQVGGSLRIGSAVYIERQADTDLYQALLKGEFCYVLTARQMGKSSLRVHTKQQLQAVGVHCASVDLTRLGSTNITPAQWYKGLILDLMRGFGLRQTDPFKTWWEEYKTLSGPQQLSQWLDDVLLPLWEQDPIVIFIDEIDSVLSLPFAVDDFFAWIRSCYNLRPDNPAYNRLTFALFGVATPADLIVDRTRTPFNLGHAIALTGFQMPEAQPLAAGLRLDDATATSVLERILYWTGGQPFLTQKVCQLVAQKGALASPLSCHHPFAGSPQDFVDHLVQTAIIHHWESQDEPEHLRTIRDRLLYDEYRMGHLLGLYQRVLQAELADAGETGNGEKQPVRDSQEWDSQEWVSQEWVDSRDEIDLLLSGLVIKQGRILRVKNPIYQAVFSLVWIERQLERQRPYAAAIAGWLASDRQDTSRLLGGRALQDALAWAQNQHLSDVDYQFLSASEESDRLVVQNRLEAARLRAVEAQLVQEQRTNRLQRLLLGTISLALVGSSALAIVAFQQYRHAVTQEIQALTRSALTEFAWNRRLDALLDALHAEQNLDQLSWISRETRAQVDTALQLTVYGVMETNRLTGHQSWVNGVAFSPDGKFIASASLDHTIKLWNRDGKLLATLQGHSDGVNRVAFSPDGTILASTSYDKTIKLWKITPTAIQAHPYRTLQGHERTVWGVAFSPDGRWIASASWDGTVKLWPVDGKAPTDQAMATLTGHQDQVWAIAFSPDGQLLATTSSDKTVKLWQQDDRGSFQMRQTLTGHQDSVLSVAFSPDGSQLVTAGDDRTIRFWHRDRQGYFQPDAKLRGSKTAVWSLAFSQDGKAITSASADGAITLWQADRQGHFRYPTYTPLGYHGATAWDVAISPNGQWVASASSDNTVKLWRTRNPLLSVLNGHNERISAVTFSTDGRILATASRDKTVRLWQQDGVLINLLRGHQAEVNDVAISPNQTLIATASWDRTVKLWRPDGTLLKTLTGHTDGVESVAFSPDGQLLATGGYDNTIRLWQRTGTLLATLKGHKAEVNAVAFSPDGSQLVSVSGDAHVKFWTATATGSFMASKTFIGHTARVVSVRFSPDGQRLATASWDHTVKLWHRDGTLLATLKGHQAAVNAVAFSADGQFLATAGDDMTIKLWQARGQGAFINITTLRSHTARTTAVAFSPDGQTLASTSDDKTVILWKLRESQHLDPFTYGCHWLRDYLNTNVEARKSNQNLCH